MARSSTLTDDVDPAPRILRLLASSFFASGDPAFRRLAARLRHDADVLEGATMTAVESNRCHGRMLARERRARPGLFGAGVVVGRAPRTRSASEEERWRREAQERQAREEAEAARVAALPLPERALALAVELTKYGSNPTARTLFDARPTPATPEWTEAATRFLADLRRR